MFRTGGANHAVEQGGPEQEVMVAWAVLLQPPPATPACLQNTAAICASPFSRLPVVSPCS